MPAKCTPSRFTEAGRSGADAEVKEGSRPPLELHHWDAELLGLVGEVFLEHVVFFRKT